MFHLQPWLVTCGDAPVAPAGRPALLAHLLTVGMPDPGAPYNLVLSVAMVSVAGATTAANARSRRRRKYMAHARN